MRRLTSVLTLALAGAMTLPAGCDSSHANGAILSSPTPACSQLTVPVTLSPSDPTVYHIAGQLCLRPDRQRGVKTVELLVSGLTYDHSYWDIGYQPKSYSYVYSAGNHGYSTFNIDRLGVGTSDHPPADKLTLQAHAHVMSQIVEQLHKGSIGGISFSTVVGVGHSMGAAILQYEAGTVTDPVQVPDYLVLSDYLYSADPAVVARIGAALYPAEQDPRFVSAGMPLGYLTTRPGSRAELFFRTDAADAADPAVVTVDEMVKQTTTLSERTTLAAARDLTVMHAIRVPVLLTVGEYDALDCNVGLGLSCAGADAVLARERAHYSDRACLSAFVVPGAGHATNLHRKASAAYDYVNDWLDNYTLDPSAPRDANGCVTA